MTNFKQLLVIVFFLLLGMDQGNAIGYSLIGDQVEGALTTNNVSVDVLSPFTGDTVIVGQEQEFQGELRAHWHPDEDFNVQIDIFDDYFTVETESTNDWGNVTAIGVGEGHLPMFIINLSDLDGGEAITSVTLNEGLSLGYITPAYFRYIDFTDNAIEIAFDWCRPGNIYHFDINAVPIPSAVWLLGSGLLGLVGFRRKFRKEGK